MTTLNLNETQQVSGGEFIHMGKSNILALIELMEKNWR